MNVPELKRMLTSFADVPADVDISRGTLTAQIRDEIIDAKLEANGGTDGLVVIENGARHQALQWVLNRIAKLPILADRILTNIAEPDFFVTPSGSFNDDLGIQGRDDDVDVSNSCDKLHERLSNNIPGTTSVVYLTSDAGEGKTTLINHLARVQAKAFKEKRAQWLLLPVSLGGKAFMRFDDVIIAALVNRMRFPFYYYEAVIELIKCGAVVPAFDGFEEMFIEGSSGEVVSALGTMLDALDSSGNVLFAARKAFFEYRSLATQARLFDSVGGRSVSFSRLALNRWSKQQFVQYSELRGHNEGDALFQMAVSRLGNEHHSLLTRAVLVKRLIDVADNLESTVHLLDKLGKSPQDYFYNFVDAIVVREANEKWLTKTGEVQVPLLTVNEHHQLLGMIAREMWLASSNTLRYDLIDVISELFLDQRKKTASDSRQVKERIKQHSLLIAEEGRANVLRFDHVDFQNFYLGESLGELLRSGATSEIRSFLSVALLPQETCDQALQHFSRHNGDKSVLLKALLSISGLEPPLSFAKENCGSFVVRLLDKRDDVEGIKISGVGFAQNSLLGRSLTNIEFYECYFQATELEETELTSCNFVLCTFDRLDIARSTVFVECRFKNCDISSVILKLEDSQLFNPGVIQNTLTDLGCHFSSDIVGLAGPTLAIEDPRFILIERFVRIFYRRTHADESLIRLKLGKAANQFFEEIMPVLIKKNIVEEASYRGSGVQKRYRLRAWMHNIQKLLSTTEDNFDEFLDQLAATIE